MRYMEQILQILIPENRQECGLSRSSISSKYATYWQRAFRSPVPDRPRIKFVHNRNSVGLFLDLCLIQLSDNAGGHTKSKDEIQALIDLARAEIMPEEY